MKHSQLLVFCSLAASLLAPHAATGVFAQSSQPAASQPAPAPVPWLKTLNDAYAAAQKKNQPVFVVVGASWCLPCRELEQQIETPAVQEQLKLWTCVRLDVDESPEVIKTLSIGPIPALRVLSPSGHIIAAQSGYVEAGPLVDWLKQQAPRALPAPVPEALVTHAVTPTALPALIAALGDTDVTIREAGIRRLITAPQIAAPAVLESFEKGKLATRLATLEVLTAWNAPVQGLDPWRPDTITPERLNALRAWKPPADAPATAPATLPAAQLSDARAQIHHFLIATDSDAQAIRERLARLGPAVLPEVYAALKIATDDQQHQRLTMLRYRLVASDRLALAWPTGFDRMAASAVKTRHAALDELAAQVTAADTALLLELFSDPDALVRETSLRLLRSVGGDEATGTLISLLSDPDPNVRAAVLKQFAEEPVPALAAQIAQYTTTEKDPDLLLHAARVLRNAGNEAAIKGLYALLKHDSWRVRAEAADGLAAAVTSASKHMSTDAAVTAKVDLYTTMLNLLQDKDPFVVSRALLVFESADTLPSVDPLVAAADKFPELLPEVVKILALGKQHAAVALPHLQRFAAHTDPAIRAVAIKGIVTVAGAAAAPAVLTALQDKNARVRIAASEALMDRLDTLSPWESSYSNRGDNPRNDPWLAAFHTGRGRPEWISALRPQLEAMLDASDANERYAAAMPLIAMGYHAKALPVLQALAISDEHLAESASTALPWLEWDNRLALFNQLRSSAAGRLHLNTFLRQFTTSISAGSADVLWKLLHDPDFAPASASVTVSALRDIYLGNVYGSQVSSTVRNAVVAVTKDKLESGTDLERLAALVLLNTVAPETAVQKAAAFLDDPKTSPALKLDALHVLLVTLPQDLAEKKAVAAMSSSDAQQRRSALLFLARGPDSIQYLRGDIYLYHTNSSYSYTAAGPIQPTAPKGLTVESLKPLLNDQDPQLAATAGYLLALLKDSSGLQTLLKYHQDSKRDSSQSNRMVYRAITALNAEDQLPVLQAIYAEIKKDRDYEMREFYWTIRAMPGDKVAEFRKIIRQEIGMDRLR